ncbi:MAG: glycosyltransferase, partial [Bacteroidota bacterium]|nr:glycosyltransferase [Bacteroidota bacterium]
MTAFNAETTIKESVESVLKQTEKEFLLLIVDDASTDATPEIILSFKDSRIKLLRNEKNLRMGGAANVALEKTDSPFILRIDSDDLCMP